MKASWNRYFSYENSYISKLFVGQLESAVTCGDCGYVSTVFEVFWDLSVPVPQADSSLHSCLDHFFDKERLDSYTCCKCKVSNATRVFRVVRWPHILTIRNIFINKNQILNVSGEEEKYPAV